MDQDPERAVWCAVLLRGLYDLSHRSGLVRVQARQWFENMDRSGPGSLRWVCSVTGFDVHKVRAHALKAARRGVRYTYVSKWRRLKEMFDLS
jgi:hypothetical protein